MVKFVDKNWLSRQAKEIETKNLRRYGRSIALISMLSSFHPCVICHHGDAVEIDYDVYKVIRAKLLSE